ncbi:hypothetical protein C2S51_017219 [Perilla frutescens var. frutescens]|nr:hypothetical protein C2S51_017219 [Perilla frutescens var. frutescens]
MMSESYWENMLKEKVGRNPISGVWNFQAKKKQIAMMFQRVNQRQTSANSPSAIVSSYLAEKRAPTVNVSFPKEEQQPYLG